MPGRKKVNEEQSVTKLPWEPTDVIFNACLIHDALRDGSRENADKVVVGQRRKQELARPTAVITSKLCCLTWCRYAVCVGTVPAVGSLGGQRLSPEYA